MEIVVWCEVFLDEVEEGFGDLGLYIFASTRWCFHFYFFGGCGCVVLAVVKGFVKSKLLFSLFQWFVYWP